MGTILRTTRSLLVASLVIAGLSCGQDESTSTSFSLKYPGPCTETSYDRSGNPETARSFTYDREGRVETESYTPLMFSHVVYRTRYAYDAHGKVRETVMTSSEFPDEQAHAFFENEYNEIGEQVRYRFDKEADGQTDSIVAIAPGKHGPMGIWRDDLDTGEPVDSYDTFEYDEEGRKVRVHRREGEIEEVIRYGYDENGLLTEETQDRAPLDGPDWRLSHTYDDLGNRIATEHAYKDGQTRTRTTYTYDCF